MKAILAFVGIAFSTVAYGQAPREDVSFPYNHPQMMTPHQNSAKTTSDMRLLATSTYVFDNTAFVPADSSQYFYNNASNDYNLKMDYQYSSSANVWVHNSRQVQRFYPNGAIDSNLTQVYLS